MTSIPRRLAALFAWIRGTRRSHVDLRAPFAELADSWRELIPGWPGWDDASRHEASPLSVLRLGGPALALVEQFAEPAVRIELRGTVVVARFVERGHRYAAALWQARVAAIRCTYDGEPPAPRQREHDAAEAVAPVAGASTWICPNGWLVALADCPVECIKALGSGS